MRGETMSWSWYAEAYDLLRKHLMDNHDDKWAHNDDELCLFEDEFVYGEFKHGDDHEVSCPWCDCDWKLKFTTHVRMTITNAWKVKE